MIPIHANPFVPGFASGELHRRTPSTTPGILLLHFDELEPFTEPPSGLIIIGGAPLAHSMIQLYGLGIPTVIVTDEQAAQLREGSHISVDGFSGWICDHGMVDHHAYTQAGAAMAGQPVHTADGIPIELRASVANVQAVRNALANGATSIGMVRSEFLFQDNGPPPDEAYYLSALERICREAAPLPVTVRTLDLAPDKHPPWLGELTGMSGPLGLRGSRLYPYEPVKSVFRAELKAVDRLASTYDIRLLLPYMTSPDELTPLIEIIRRHIKRPVPLGVMIETPAAALALPEWLQQVEFMVIGCNDLMQCLFAADRDIAEVSPLLDPYSPVLYRFLRQVADSADDELHRIQLGGLLSQVPGVLPLLIGMGYRNFSVEPLLTPCIANACAETDSIKAWALMDKACSASGPAEIRTLLGLPGDYLWGVAERKAH